MPYMWVENEPVINNYRGVTLYHIYKNDDYDSPRAYCFTDDSNGTDCNLETSFDIREWSGYNPQLTIEQNLIAMIDSGYFGRPDQQESLFTAEQSQERVCPVCGCSFLYPDGSSCYDGEQIVEENNIGYRFTCKNCGCEGTEWHRAVFDGYAVK